jgi:hypothetical protein
MSYHYSAIPHFRELFDCPRMSYHYIAIPQFRELFDFPSYVLPLHCYITFPGTFRLPLACPTIIVLYHISGNFLTAPRMPYHYIAIPHFRELFDCPWCTANAEISK